MKHGVDVIPVFSFGETDLHVTITPPGANFLKKLLHVAIVFPVGRCFSLMPYAGKPQHMVIGNIIEVSKFKKGALGGCSEEEELEKLHLAYKAAINNVFEENKAQLGHADFKLNVE